jgi:Transposase IS116/IS110/IS902 family
VHKNIAVDLVLIGHDDQLLRDVELSFLIPAKQHNANTLSLPRTAPGIGELLSLVLPYEIHDLQGFSHVQKFVSYCRFVKCAMEWGGGATAPRGARLATPISFERSRNRPCSFYAPILWARRIAPAWRKRMARARH